MISEIDAKPLKVNDVPDLVKIASNHFFKPGQVIFYEGHQPYGLFILVDGTVQFESNQKQPKKINGSAILGINSFMNFKAYNGTVKAVTPCKVSFISKTAYQKLVSETCQKPWLDS